MAELARLDIATRVEEAKIRALLEDLLPYYKELYPESQLALAVWFEKSPRSPNHDLLMLFAEPWLDEIRPGNRQSLGESGSNDPPFVQPYSASVAHFTQQLESSPDNLARFFDKCEVLYFDKAMLTEPILRAFNVITEPSGLLKGWYVSADEYGKAGAVRNLLSSRVHMKPEIGLVKTEESPDFHYCRGILHVEIGQRWLPMSPRALENFSFYTELQAGNPGYLLFQGGSLYHLLKFEVKTAPEYSSRLLERVRDDRYPELYLRAVHPPEQSGA